MAEIVVRNLVKKHGAYYYVRRENGKKKWLHLGREYQQAVDRLQTLRGASGAGGNLVGCLPDCFYRARRNAVRRGLEFSLSRQEFNDIAIRSALCCEVTGIPFSLSWARSRKNRPFAPSLDRIDSSVGYTATNCRLVCVAVNLAMSEWGEPVLQRIADAFASRRVYRETRPVEPSLGVTT